MPLPLLSNQRQILEKRTIKPTIIANAEYIENPRASSVFTQQTGQPDVEVSVNVGASLLEDHRYEILSLIHI